MIKLVVVDDHALFREGLTTILRMEPGIEVCGLAGNVQEAVEIVHEKKPDIILMDFSLPDGTGAVAARVILEDHPNCKIIFLTISEDDESLFAAIRSGAKGYVLKNISPKKLISVIRAVHDGEGALSGSMTLRLMETFSKLREPARGEKAFLSSFSMREKDVLHGIAGGLSNKEIAETLFISTNTVKYYVHSILEKLDLPNRRSVAVYVKDHGLLE